MRLTVVGCSGSYAGPASPASAYLVQAHDATLGRPFNLLLDLGNGALGALQRHIPLDHLDALVLSHLHPDHCADTAGLYVHRKYRQGGTPEVPLPLHGPAGTRERIAAAYGGLAPGGMDAEFAFHTVTDGATTTLGPFTVTAYRVNHPVEAYGYRVAADGAVLAYTGDTDSCAALGPLMAGATLALADCAFVDGRDTSEGIHLSGSRAARAASDAGGVQRLMLTHLPPWNDPQVCVAQAAPHWDGEVELAAPDTAYEL